MHVGCHVCTSDSGLGSTKLHQKPLHTYPFWVLRFAKVIPKGIAELYPINKWTQWIPTIKILVGCSVQSSTLILIISYHYSSILVSYCIYCVIWGCEWLWLRSLLRRHPDEPHRGYRDDTRHSTEPRLPGMLRAKIHEAYRCTSSEA